MDSAFFRRLYAVGLSVLLVLGLYLPMARAEDLTKVGGYQVTVKVVPRIGSFLAGVYKEAWARDCFSPSPSGLAKLGWMDYRSKLDASRAPMAYKLPNALIKVNTALRVPDWDILVTTGSGGDQQCGYRARRVVISVQSIADPDAALNCTFDFSATPGLEFKRLPAETTTGCTFYAAIKSNREVPFSIEIKDVDATEVTRTQANIPEDVLIASLGDSFASGEGNPDVPGRNALWMDARCHRSAYAGPIRAALRILNHQQEISNDRYRRSLSAGALTVVSFACSGALISQGLNGPYAGVTTYQEALDAYPTLQATEDSAKPFGPDVSLQPQIFQFREFLENQGNAPKQNVDLLLLSGGGNDILFSRLVTAMALKNIEAPKLKASIDKSLQAHMDALKLSYRYFRISLDAFNASYPVMQTILVKYPDPLYRKENVNCSESVAYGIFGSKALSLTDAEVNYVRKDVLFKLNDIISAQPESYKNGWLSLDAMSTDVDSISDHGWCLQGAKSAYETQGRWFRTFWDSREYQGDVNGSFHPTFEFNEKIQGVLIAKKFFQSVNAEPVWDALTVSPAVRRGDVWVVPASATIRYQPVTTLRPLLTKASMPSVHCEASADGCVGTLGVGAIGAHGQGVVFDATAFGNDTRRIYMRKNLLNLRVDSQPPVIGCAYNGAALPCASLGWLKGREITISATDVDSGMQSAFLTMGGGTVPLVQVPLISTSDNSMETRVQFPADGEYQLSLCATDGVGNRSGDGAFCSFPLTVRIDTTVPTLKTMMAHNVDWSGAGRTEVPTVPIFGALIPKLAIGLNTKLAPLTCGISGDSCPVVPPLPAKLWTREFQTVELSNAANNKVAVRYAVVRVPDFHKSNPLRTIKGWQAEKAALATSLHVVLAIAPSLVKLVDTKKADVQTALNAVQRDDVEAATRQKAAQIVFNHMQHKDLVVSWLNLINGAIYFRETVKAKDVLDCLPPAGVNIVDLQQVEWHYIKTQCIVEKVKKPPALLARNSSG